MTLNNDQLRERIAWLRRLMWANDPTEKAISEICDALEARLFSYSDAEAANRWLRAHPNPGDSEIVEDILLKLFPDEPNETEHIGLVFHEGEVIGHVLARNPESGAVEVILYDAPKPVATTTSWYANFVTQKNKDRSYVVVDRLDIEDTGGVIHEKIVEHELASVQINSLGTEFKCSCGASISNVIYPHNAFYAMGQHLGLIPPTKIGESNE